MMRRKKGRSGKKGSPVRKRILAAVLAIVSSGFGLPYAWEGVQGVMQYFTSLRSDVSALKVEQAELKGQVTQIQSDLEIVLGRQMPRVARGDEIPVDQNQTKEGSR